MTRLIRNALYVVTASMGDIVVNDQVHYENQYIIDVLLRLIGIESTSAFANNI